MDHANNIPVENPFRARFWVGTIDARAVALFRIAIALLTLLDLVDRLRDFHAFYSTGGMIFESLLEPDATRFSLLDGVTSPAGMLTVYCVGIVAAVGLAAGWRSRGCALVTAVIIHSIDMRNPFVLDGSDLVLRTLLFWAIFMDLGATWSLDARRRGARRWVWAMPVRAAQLSIAMVYVSTGLLKHGAAWRDGTAVYYVLANPSVTRSFAMGLTRSVVLCKLLTWFTLATELAWAPLVFAGRRPRAVALCAGLILHGGIFLTMRIGWFSLIMLSSYPLFLLPGWLQLLPPRLQATDENSPRSRKILVVLIALQLTLVAWLQLAHLVGDRRLRVPYLLQSELILTGLHGNWGMFAPEPSQILGRFEARGTLTDGTSVDATDALPDLKLAPGWFYDRWRKVAGMMSGPPSTVHLLVSRHLCARYNAGTTGARLAEFTLVLHQAQLQIGKPPLAMPDREYVHQRCIAEPNMH
jgi:hypothetical protein